MQKAQIEIFNVSYNGSAGDKAESPLKVVEAQQTAVAVNENPVEGPVQSAPFEDNDDFLDDVFRNGYGESEDDQGKSVDPPQKEKEAPASSSQQGGPISSEDEISKRKKILPKGYYILNGKAVKKQMPASTENAGENARVSTNLGNSLESGSSIQFAPARGAPSGDALKKYFAEVNESKKVPLPADSSDSGSQRSDDANAQQDNDDIDLFKAHSNIDLGDIDVDSDENDAGKAPEARAAQPAVEATLEQRVQESIRKKVELFEARKKEFEKAKELNAAPSNASTVVARPAVNAAPSNASNVVAQPAENEYTDQDGYPIIYDEDPTESEEERERQWQEKLRKIREVERNRRGN